jgi:hypothetical protein
MNVKASFHSGKLSVDRNGKENFSLCYSRANRSSQILYFIFEQSDWSMKQEVRNFLRNLSNCWGIVQRNSSKLGNELINIFRNASIGTTVKSLVPTQSSQDKEKFSCPLQSTDNFPEWKLAFNIKICPDLHKIQLWFSRLRQCLFT